VHCVGSTEFGCYVYAVCKHAALGAGPGSWPAAAMLARVLRNVLCSRCLLQLLAESDRAALAAGSCELIVLAMHSLLALETTVRPGLPTQKVAARQFSEGFS
jgi:hypothetical protein